MVFDPATVKADRIKEDADYEGVRVRFVGLLGKARAAMQIDVGFGDVITPGAENITYPALLDFPAAELSGYPRETVVRGTLTHEGARRSCPRACGTHHRRVCRPSIRLILPQFNRATSRGTIRRFARA
jgi:hypothetical protein